jgi:hypothetical protein
MIARRCRSACPDRKLHHLIALAVDSLAPRPERALGIDVRSMSMLASGLQHRDL